MPDDLYKIDTGKYFWVEAKSSSYISYFTILYVHTLQIVIMVFCFL